MQTLSKVLRNIALALLSGGSSAIVFAAVILVKAATAHGVPVSEAAAANSPVFIQYSRVALAAAVLLAIAELIDFATVAQKSRLDHFRYVSSLICICLVGVFAFGIVPPMEKLLPDIKNISDAQQQFHHLHEISRAVFGASILFGFISLLLPAFQTNNQPVAIQKQGLKKEENFSPS